MDHVVHGEAPGDSEFPTVDDPPIDADLSGRLYSIGAGNMVIEAPSGLDTVKAQLFPHNLLIYVVDQAGTRLQLAMALAGDDGRQNHCEVVRTLPVADWSNNPAFLVGPGSVQTTFAGSAATFLDFQLYGVFEPDAARFGHGVLEAGLDLRDLQAALPGTDCTALEGYGGSCGACPDGELQCFELRVTQFKGDFLDSAFDSRETGDCQ